ncbi:MAG: hypothetical protein ACSLEN_10025 [Candidatus Malihini olakiniferum]
MYHSATTKDANHEPELVFTLTSFQAMKGFQEHDDIVALLEPVASAHPSIIAYLQKPDDKNLSMLLANLLSMSGKSKERALAVLKNLHLHHSKERTLGSAAQHGVAL